MIERIAFKTGVNLGAELRSSPVAKKMSRSAAVRRNIIRYGAKALEEDSRDKQTKGKHGAGAREQVPC